MTHVKYDILMADNRCLTNCSVCHLNVLMNTSEPGHRPSQALPLRVQSLTPNFISIIEGEVSTPGQAHVMLLKTD